MCQDLVSPFTSYFCLTTYFKVYFEYICIRTGFIIGKWKDVYKAEKVQIRVYVQQVHSLQKLTNVGDRGSARISYQFATTHIVNVVTMYQKYTIR